MAHAGRRSLPGAGQGVLAALASVALLLVGGARGASFSVATGSMRVKEPPSVAGAYDSAIGDVSGSPEDPCCPACLPACLPE